MKVKLILMTTVVGSLGGCVVPPVSETQANEAELAAVRVVPVSQVDSCEFITQANILQGQSFLGGQAELAGNAEKRMKQKALSVGADTMVVSDRIYDDGAGTGKQPTLSLYADLYRCKAESAPGFVRPASEIQSIEKESASRTVESEAVTKSMLLEVQSELKKMGYYTGAIDGIYGPESAKAVRAFQKDRSLPVSGKVDLATLDALGIGR